MNEAFAGELRRAAAARSMPLDAADAAALAVHCGLLLRWNRTVRLTAITDPGEVRDRHVLESLEAVRFLPGGPGLLVDVGSGNGFPALPLLLLRPDLRGELLEPVVRKRAFLKEVIRELRMADRVAVLPDRVEAPDDLRRRAPFLCLTARAVGRLDVLLAGAAAGLSPQGRAVLYVGSRDAVQLQAGVPAGLWLREAYPLPGRRASFLAVLGRAEAAA